MDSSNKNVVRGVDSEDKDTYAEVVHFPGAASQDFNELAHRIAHPEHHHHNPAAMDKEHGEHGLQSTSNRVSAASREAASSSSSSSSSSSGIGAKAPANATAGSSAPAAASGSPPISASRPTPMSVVTTEESNPSSMTSSPSKAPANATAASSAPAAASGSPPLAASRLSPMAVPAASSVPGSNGPAGPADTPPRKEGFSNRFDDLVHRASDGITNILHAIEDRIDQLVSHRDTSSNSSSSSSSSERTSTMSAVAPAGSTGAARGAMEMQNLESEYSFKRFSVPSSSTTTTTHPHLHHQHELSPPMDDVGTDFSLWQRPTEEEDEEIVEGGSGMSHPLDLPSQEQIEMHNYAPDRPLKQQQEERMAREAATREQVAQGK